MDEVVYCLIQKMIQWYDQTIPISSKMDPMVFGKDPLDNAIFTLMNWWII